MHGRSTAKILTKFALGIGLNVATVAAGYREYKKNQDWFNKQSPEIQEKIRTKCPLTREGSAMDSYAAIQERIAMDGSLIMPENIAKHEEQKDQEADMKIVIEPYESPICRK